MTEEKPRDVCDVEFSISPSEPFGEKLDAAMHERLVALGRDWLDESDASTDLLASSTLDNSLARGARLIQRIIEEHSHPHGMRSAGSAVAMAASFIDGARRDDRTARGLIDVQWLAVTPDGIEECMTPGEARELAMSCLEPDGEWHENIESVSWGAYVSVEHAIERDRVETPGGEFDYQCNYMLTASPTSVVVDLAASMMVAQDSEVSK